MRLTFEVTPQEDGAFLRDVLRHKGVSTALSASVKRCGGFWADGVPIRADQRVAAGAAVSFELPPEGDTSVIPEQIPLAIVYEDEHAMVLEKPAGMAVHPTRGEVCGTLANAFCGLLRARGQKGVFRPINRLDKGTSGLVLCAMNAYAAPLLAKSARKVYYALCAGTPPAKAGEFCGPIARRGDSILAGACRRRASRPAHAIACWRRGPGAFWRPVRLARAAPIKFACTFPMRAARCWAIGCTAAIPPRWGGPPCTAGCCNLQRLQAGPRAPRPCRHLRRCRGIWPPWPRRWRPAARCPGSLARRKPLPACGTGCAEM